ncbi:MAG: AAA family ATPase [Phycisphaerae bacterium]|nr:AAA family ATPase [Phycisphaerae bacterium]
MIQSIEIKNLRGIRDGKLEGLAPLTILVGPNGCGKSTILDALLIAAHPVPPLAVARTVTRRKGVKQGARWLVWRADETKKIVAQVTNKQGRALHCTLEFQRAKTNEVARILLQLSIPDGVYQVSAMLFFTTGNKYQYDVSGDFLEFVPEVRFVETYDYEGEPLHTLYTRTVEQGRRQQAESIINELLPNLRGIMILTEGESPIVHLVYDDHTIPAALAGDGIHDLLRMVLELSACPEGLVLVEEPEVHQHPGAIYWSAQVLRAAVRREIQVVLTTHSLELIDALLASASQEDLDNLCLFRLNLKDGELISSRLPGSEVAFARHEIEDDLR